MLQIWVGIKISLSLKISKIGAAILLSSLIRSDFEVMLSTSLTIEVRVFAFVAFDISIRHTGVRSRTDGVTSGICALRMEF
jgi:hypothetical protein